MEKLIAKSAVRDRLFKMTTSLASKLTLCKNATEMENVLRNEFNITLNHIERDEQLRTSQLQNQNVLNNRMVKHKG